MSRQRDTLRVELTFAKCLQDAMLGTVCQPVQSHEVCIIVFILPCLHFAREETWYQKCNLSYHLEESGLTPRSDDSTDSTVGNMRLKRACLLAGSERSVCFECGSHSRKQKETRLKMEN